MKIDGTLISLSVRELVEFVLRQGSIHTSFVSNNRAVLGTLAHKKVQESMEGNYEKEVRLVHEHRDDELVFVVEGRADGIIRDLVAVTIDEIKSTTTDLSKIDEDFNPLHWAQAKCYAYIYALQNSLVDINVRLTYYHLETKQIKHLVKVYSKEELTQFWEDIIRRYAVWVRYYREWIQKRDISLKSYQFPFSEYRAGQREMAVSIYKSIQNGENLYVNAPTGTGKTISTLFPTIKAMGEGHVGKIFYLTAKTITRTVAENTMLMIGSQGATIKSITLTAKDKICFLDKRNCTPTACPYADGHFDRVDDAVMDALKHEDIFTREVIERYAKEHRVCPFEFALDVAVYVDVVIGDYNYMFDPTVALKRFLDAKNFVILVDEAHNLVERAREMYSASLSKRQFSHVKQSLGTTYPTIRTQIQKLINYLLDVEDTYINEVGVYITKDYPKDMYMKLKRFTNECEKKLQGGSMGSLPSDLLDLYFEAIHFMKIYDFFDERYVTYGESSGYEILFKMFCIDPSYMIGEMISACKSVIFFSATLLPIKYYKYMLGGEQNNAIYLPSPFDNTNAIRMIASDVSTRYRDRDYSYSKIVDYIEQMIETNKGNYMIFFPSYKYMEEVHNLFIAGDNTCEVLLQQVDMSEDAREEFLERFEEKKEKSLVAFCVLGGIFSEGIDLVGDKLIGVIVVGVGIPQIGLEKNLIRHHFDDQEEEGYHYAYTYPGMNKVLQAVGRLIRSTTDVGSILLIDDRFLSETYQHLLPREFWPYHIVTRGNIGGKLNEFWNSKKVLKECNQGLDRLE